MNDLPDIDAIWNYADNAGTERRFREVLPAAEASGNAAYLAELLTQLARAEGRQKRFDEAHRTLDRAESLPADGMTRAKVRALLERGRLHNSSGSPAAALPFFHDAHALARAASLHRLAVDAIHMIAIVAPTPGEQVEWNLRGVALANEVGQRPWLRALYNNLGEAYAAQSDFANALFTFEKLRALLGELGLPPDMMTQKDIAKMMRLLGRHAAAMAVLEPLQAELAAAGKTNAWVDEEYAECLLALGRERESQPYFARAYAGQRENDWVVQREPAKLERLRQRAATTGSAGDVLK